MKEKTKKMKALLHIVHILLFLCNVAIFVCVTTKTPSIPPPEGVPQWPIYFLMYCDPFFAFHAFSSNYPCHQCLLIFFLSYLHLHTHQGTSIISYFKKEKQICFFPYIHLLQTKSRFSQIFFFFNFSFLHL